MQKAYTYSRGDNMQKIKEIRENEKSIRLGKKTST